MPDESTPASPDTPPPYGQAPRVGTGLVGETTRNADSTILPDANVRPLEVIGDFEVMSKLGQGGMGAVYRARQVSLNRQVALKVLPSNFQADADYVSRFQREARVAASLSHANLVKVYAAGVADGCHYIAMELIEGDTLGHWIKRPVRPPLESLRIILDVARALEYGWRSAKLIHRDIKPGNIFLSVDGAVKLGDLGLAKIIGSDSTGLTQTGTAMGTPHYISPEQARGDRDLDFRADIYSLGCTLYQMVTQQTPYSGHEPMVVMNQHINAAPPAILKVMPQCPLPLARLVSKMLKKQRRERPASYEELIAALESVRAQLDPALTAAIMASRFAAVEEKAADETPKVGMDRRAIPDQGTLGEPSLPPKSKLPLYGGIVAGVLTLAVAAFFLWPKEEKLTKAQIYAREHAAEQQAQANADAGRTRSGASQASGDEGRGSPVNQPPLVPSATSVPSEATKDAPFVNTLGMKFVPVPISGGVGRVSSPAVAGGDTGPTTPVLFSVWDTRVQDYEVFAKETKHEWLKAEFEQSPTHPAVRVSWEDAQAFCAWLTERERKAGRLGGHRAVGALAAGTDGAVPSSEQKSWVYRLPSDHEWSCAVGIGGREDAAKLPSEKNQKIFDVLPWGTQWPPPEKAGNYWSEELRPQFAAGKYYWIKGELTGRHDGYANTSPVGSYAANQFGLYDMGGNAWQWCEDWYDNDQKARVQRGASWMGSDRGALVSSFRAHNAPAARFSEDGFRCVLAPAASTPPATLSTATYPQPPKWIDATADLRSGRLADASVIAEGDWLKATRDFTTNVAGDLSLRNPILRVIFSERVTPCVRQVIKDGQTGRYQGGIRPGHAIIERIGESRLTGRLTDQKLDSPDHLDGEHEAVFAAQGDTLTLWLDGKVVAAAHDGTLSVGGIGVLFNKGDGRIKKVEYGELPDPTPAVAHLSPSAEPWQDVVHDPAKLGLGGGAERTPEGLRIPDAGSAMRPPGRGPKRDGAVRMLATFGGARPILVGRGTAAGIYQLYARDAKRVVLNRYDNGTKQSTDLREFPLAEPLQPGQDYELELRVVGQTLTAKFNGEVLGTVTDGTLQEGGFGVEASGHNGTPSLVKALEVLDLDAP